MTQEELDAMPAKTKKFPEVVQMYLENDYLDAYAMHTDQRILQTGAKLAVGSGDNWDSHGDLQFAFLKKSGLLPSHRLLEVGCGTGRLARKVVPYLERGHYTGVDISNRVLDALYDLAVKEGWIVNEPMVVLGDVPEHGEKVDFVWAFSVFIHLPYDICVDVARRVRRRLALGGQFLFSYVPEEKSWRSGVKQFRHTLEEYRNVCVTSGLTFDDVPDWISWSGYEPGRWSGGQRVACARRV